MLNFIVKYYCCYKPKFNIYIYIYIYIYFVSLHGSKYYCKERKSQKREKKISKLNLLMESDTVKEREFNIQNIIEHREVIDIINSYE